MARYDAREEQWTPMEIKGVRGYFCDLRIDRATVPNSFDFWELADGTVTGRHAAINSGYLSIFSAHSLQPGGFRLMTWSTGKAILTVKMNGDFLTVPIHFQRLRKWKGARNPVDFGFARTRMERGWIQMVKLSSGQYVIGFDNGYQFGKTAQSLFDNGVYAMGTVEPTVKEHSLKYGRKYYKVGEGRAAITEDKVSDENARLLTMVAIAKELRTEEIHKAEVILAVGLPFSDYGREKKALLEYYGQKPALKYEYEGIRYDVTISRIFVFPQCYSAIAPRLANMKGDYLVVDIGSKTTDVLLLKNGMPVERRSITVEKAMVKWMKQIQGRLQIQYGKNVPESEILKIVLKKDSFLPRNQVNHVRETLKELVHDLELELMEREFDLQYTNVIYVGGGAVAVKNFSEPRTNVAFDTDIHANAKGYEFLAMQMLKKQGVA